MLNLPAVLEDLVELIHEYEVREDAAALGVLLPLAEAVEAASTLFRARRSASIQAAVQRHAAA